MKPEEFGYLGKYITRFVAKRNIQGSHYYSYTAVHTTLSITADSCPGDERLHQLLSTYLLNGTPIDYLPSIIRFTYRVLCTPAAIPGPTSPVGLGQTAKTMITALKIHHAAWMGHASKPSAIAVRAIRSKRDRDGCIALRGRLAAIVLSLEAGRTHVCTADSHSIGKRVSLLET